MEVLRAALETLTPAQRATLARIKQEKWERKVNAGK